MSDYLLAGVVLGGWTVFSLYYFNRAYNSPSTVNPYILDNIPSIFPTLGIMCTAIGIMMGLSDFDPNDIQSSLPRLISGLKSAFIATIAGIAGLFFSQKILAFVQFRIDAMPEKPKRASDELTALNQLSDRLEKLEIVVSTDLRKIASVVNEGNQSNSTRLVELQRLLSIQTEKIDGHQQSNVDHHERVIRSYDGLHGIQKEHTQAQRSSILAVLQKMDDGNKLLTNKFDEFSELLRKNNTEALVEVMRVSTEQFNAQMGDLIDKLVEENFKELNTSVSMLNTWQKENKDQVAALTAQVRDILEQVDNATAGLEEASDTLNQVVDLSHSLVADDGKLNKLVVELNKVMISDEKFTQITTKVDKSISTLAGTTAAFEITTKKLNDWVHNQMNFTDKAEVLIHQLEEFRNLNGAVWDKYRAEMDRSVNIIATTSKTISKDLDGINQEFYERLNDTLGNLDTLIQRFMKGQNTNRSVKI